MSNRGAAATPPPVRFADILFVAGVLDPSGQNPKQRRVVILTPNDALAVGFPIIAAPVTSQVPPVLTDDYVLLPFRNPPGTRHPATGLTRRAAIVATWRSIRTTSRDDPDTFRRGPWPSSRPRPRPPPRPSAAGRDRAGRMSSDPGSGVAEARRESRVGPHRCVR